MSKSQVFGLIGYPLSHSFSKRYYDEKIEKEKIQDVEYRLFSIPNVESLLDLLDQIPNLNGINVTIPHKISVLQFLHEKTSIAEKIGAVNCVRIERRDNGEGIIRPYLIGDNTDVFGFVESLKGFMAGQRLSDYRALILGNGGAAQAVKFGLEQLSIPYRVVSRHPQNREDLTYSDLNNEIISAHQLLINTTPLGTFPEIDHCPDIPYEYVGRDHFLYDVVYNPSVSKFLKKGLEKGSKIKNGMEMLVLQAEKNWDNWINGISK